MITTIVVTVCFVVGFVAGFVVVKFKSVGVGDASVFGKK